MAATLQDIHKHQIVVAEQKNPVRVAAGGLHQHLEDPSAIGPAIDIITEKNGSESKVFRKRNRSLCRSAMAMDIAKAHDSGGMPGFPD
jgi:hypothetical protein